MGREADGKDQASGGCQPEHNGAQKGHRLEVIQSIEPIPGTLPRDVCLLLRSPDQRLRQAGSGGEAEGVAERRSTERHPTCMPWIGPLARDATAWVTSKLAC